MKRTLKIFVTIAVAAATVLSFAAAGFALPINTNITDNYFYSQGMPMSAPLAYRTVAVKGGADLGISVDFAPSDMCVAGEYLYVLDKQSNRIVVLDEEYNLVTVISKILDTPDYTVPAIDYITYNEDGTTSESASLKKADKYSFNKPQGIYVDEDGTIYVADTENRRIVVCDFEGNCKQIYQSIRVSVLGSSFVFKPLKLLIDNTGFINIIAYGVNRGLLRIDTDGQFDSFFAQPTVKASDTDIFAKFAAEITGLTSEIKEVATEYVSATRDSSGFIYVSAYATEDNGAVALQKLNSAGDNVLGAEDAGEEGVELCDPNATKKPKIIDVALNETAGTYTLLEVNSARIFTYSSGGALLYVGGGTGVQYGKLISPSAVACRGNEVIVADTSTKSITVYELTDYAKSINDALNYYKQRNYDDSADGWYKVSRYNSNMDLAFKSLGNIDLINGRDLDDDDELKTAYFSRALNYFMQASNKSGYSDAYGELRDAQMSKYFNLLFGTVAAVAIGLFVLVQVRKIRKNKEERKRRLGL